MFLAETNWFDIGTGVLSALVVLVPSGIVVFKKAKKGWDEKGAAGVTGVLVENHKFFADLYTQFKGVVKAVSVKEEAVNDLLANISPADKDKLRAVTKMIGGATLDGTALPSIDIVGLAFKDIVNNKLMKEDAINDKILKSLVVSAKEDKDASEALNKVAGIAGAVVGEGLNIGAKVFTGGTVSAGDVVGFISGVGSSALGARSK
jgi:hypothetical protein